MLNIFKLLPLRRRLSGGGVLAVQSKLNHQGDKNDDLNLNFDLMVESRCSKAKRSILINIIRTPNESKMKSNLDDDDYNSQCLLTLNDFISRKLNCKINRIDHFKSMSKNFALIEFLSQNDADFILNSYAEHFNIKSMIRGMKTRCLTYHPKILAKHPMQPNQATTAPNIILNQDTSLEIEDLKSLESKFGNMKSLNEQILYLCNSNKIHEFSLRMKFFIASLIEDCITITHPHTRCLPFGSTLNGFGNIDSDLDISIGVRPPPAEDRPILFRFESSTKTTGVISLEELGHKLLNYVPHFNNMIHVRNAKVPIVKGEFIGINPPIEFDISHGLTEAYLMTQLLWTYSAINPVIVKPLVKLVKVWAKSINLTIRAKDGPPNSLTSFQLTVLTLAFLIHKKLVPDLTEVIRNYYLIVGDLHTFKNNPGSFKNQLIDIPKNEFDIIAKYKFTPLRDLRLQFSSNQDDKQRLFGLFLEFLEFYLNYDYKLKVCLAKVTGKYVSGNNPLSNSLYMCNPLNPSVNATASMNSVRLGRFKYALEKSLTNYSKVESSNLISLLNKVKVPQKVANSMEDIELPYEDESSLIENFTLKNDKLI